MDDNTQSLAQQHCHPQGLETLQATALPALLEQLNDWQVDTEQVLLQRSWRFDNYAHTTAFVNAVVWLAQREEHHPEICFGYRDCHIGLSTHAVQGLSINDFILAAHIDLLLKGSSKYS